MININMISQHLEECRGAGAAATQDWPDLEAWRRGGELRLEASPAGLTGDALQGLEGRPSLPDIGAGFAVTSVAAVPASAESRLAVAAGRAAVAYTFAAAAFAAAASAAAASQRAYRNHKHRGGRSRAVAATT